ncbi:7SK snRNA methylphosphate capping enzyme [Bombina bombina]|uniref:7SK snRNA methylphosphate capping enzyme n=1 Tax=Bombina bombina TaxID=8345 RepID=UPI00235A74E6|nr:7SK snRNA methylphosphate capping enzyme [Bombina bombina]XP_053574355.1 7SK snRNA methylphosphate capping enzyme [Bombina bombina]XP_053574356.1 7SK snRNA methylphosphate capping enzyme [Bombina bombina]
MQVLVEMSSSSDTIQPVEVAGDDCEKTFLAPLPISAPKTDVEFKNPKEGSEQLLPPRAPRNGFQGKRRNSFNIGFKHPAPYKRRRRVNSDCDPVLPSNFLLGGNIFDPLNLNSLLDEDVNLALNAETPKSSPLPSRNRDPVEILIPKDITDPLSLNTGSADVELMLSPLKSGRKRHRHRHHQSIEIVAKAPSIGQEVESTPEEPRPYELNTVINCGMMVVALPSLETETAVAPASASVSLSSRHRKRRRTSSKSEGKPGSPDRGGVGGSSTTKTQCGSASSRVSCSNTESAAHGKPKNRFQYGNYCRYYGYRNPCQSEDPRLRVLRPEWFKEKAVLDIGCNVGHLTLCVARNLSPFRVVGLDIDGALVNAARQNIRHYLSESIKEECGGGFPASLVVTRGPIAAPLLPQQEEKERKNPLFPHNVVFVKGNYVVDRDELVEAQRTEYDVILCLSVTKWVHLNWGDDGLKRMFRRIYKHLNPGGILILEPQPFSSYGKRKKLTENISKNFGRISFKPNQFTSYLLSSEVGFSSHELLATPHAQSKGFQRPIYAFFKSGEKIPVQPSSTASLSSQEK